MFFHVSKDVIFVWIEPWCDGKCFTPKGATSHKFHRFNLVILKNLSLWIKFRDLSNSML